MEKFTLQVTQDHINAGVKGCGASCPVALAIFDHFPNVRDLHVPNAQHEPNEHPAGIRAYPHDYSISFYTGRGCPQVKVPTTPELRAFVRTFDLNGHDAVKPTAFELESNF